MKKWEEQQRLKAHQNKIKNAKAQVPPSSNPKSSSKIKSSKISNANDSIASQRSLLSGLTQNEKEDKNQIPLYRSLLKLHNLQQYAEKLITRGFGYDLTKFALLNAKDLETLCDEIKILPGHKIKFIDLIQFINGMIPSVIQDYTETPFPQQRQSIPKKAQTAVSGKRKPLAQTQISKAKPKHKMAKQPKQTQQSFRIKKIGYDFFQDDDEDQEFNQTLEAILKKYQTHQQDFFKQNDIKTLEQQKLVSIKPHQQQEEPTKKKQPNLKQIPPQQQQYDQQKSKQMQEQIYLSKPQQQLQMKQQQQQQQQQPNIIREYVKPILKSQDDIQIIQKFKGNQLETQLKPNRLIQKLMEKTKKKKTNKFEENDDNQPNLEYSQIKMMYQSYDSGKLTSTLINLDIEEMCNCLSFAILKHINFNQKISILIQKSQFHYNPKIMNNKNINPDCSQNPIEEPTQLHMMDNFSQQKLFQSQQIVQRNPRILGAIAEKTFDNSQQQQKTEFEHSRRQIEQILKDSMMFKENEFIQEEEQYFDDQFCEEVNSDQELDVEDDDEKESPVKRKFNDLHANSYRQQKHEISQDSLQYDDSQINVQEYQYTNSQQHNINNEIDFSFESKIEMVEQNQQEQEEMRRVFQLTFNDTDQSGFIPDQETVSNYCKNIVITSKMEKEVTIICLIYIERLLIKSGFGLDIHNWRRITFIALILASKIWDDESFENDNFAQAFPTYLTKEINEMERVFLLFIDYELYVKSDAYAKYYFLLRTFAESKKKSFPLRALPIELVLKLQHNSNKAECKLREAYSNPVNKSF